MKKRSKLSQRLKRWKKKLAQNMRSYLIALLCLGVVGAGIWNASQDDDGPAQEVDFGDSLTSASARSISKASYEDALVLANDGKMAEARRVMVRLAPLSEVAEQPLGNGAAHLWLAQSMLGDFKGLFLEAFPLDCYLGNPSVAPAVFREEKVQDEITRHLEHAVALSPELKDGHLLLASIAMAKGKREESISILMRGLSYSGDRQGVGLHDSLLLALANASTFKGDDLSLKEQVWLEFSTLGREVSRSNKAGLSRRLEYAASALLLQKYEVVDIVTRKIERDFKSTGRELSSVKLANSLRVATHYFQAIHLLNAAHESGDYTSVALEVAASQKLDPGNVSLIDALRRIATAHPALRPKIKALLEQGAETDGAKSSPENSPESSAQNQELKNGVQNLEVNLDESRAKTHFLLSELSDTPSDVQSHLKSALENTPDDPEILLAYVRVLLMENAPSYPELGKLLDRAVVQAGRSFDKMAELDLARGQVFLGLNEKNAAIAALEQALSRAEEAKDKKLIHALLAKAYQQAGHPVIAAAHLERSS